MVRFVFAGFLLALIALVSSCGGGSSSVNSNSTTTDLPPIANPPSIIQPTSQEFTITVSLSPLTLHPFIPALATDDIIVTLPPIVTSLTAATASVAVTVIALSATVTLDADSYTLVLQTISIVANGAGGHLFSELSSELPVTVIQHLEVPPTSAGATMTIVTLPDTVPSSAASATVAYIPLTSTNTNAVNPCLGANVLMACTTYISYLEILRGVLSLAYMHSNVAVVHSIGVTYEGRLIPAIKISDNPQDDENEAVVLIVGGYHSREWLTINFVYLLVEYLLANKNTPAVKWHLDNSEIWIVPLLNADGRVHDDSGNSPPNYWRKNRRPLLDSVGDTVAFGVDLNRNHSFLWGESPQSVTTRWGVEVTLTETSGSNGNFNSDTYRGPTPTSEPETKAVCQLAHKIYPDVGVSYHTFGQLLLHPWGYTSGRGGAPEDEYNVAVSIAVEASVQIAAVHNNAYVAQSGSDLYATNGDFGDWMFGVLGAYSYTPELRPTTGSFYLFYPPTSEITPTFEENIPAALHFIRVAILNDRAIVPLFTPQEDCRI